MEHYHWYTSLLINRQMCKIMLLYNKPKYMLIFVYATKSCYYYLFIAFFAFRLAFFQYRHYSSSTTLYKMSMYIVFVCVFTYVLTLWEPMFVYIMIIPVLEIIQVVSSRCYVHIPFCRFWSTWPEVSFPSFSSKLNSLIWTTFNIIVLW